MRLKVHQTKAGINKEFQVLGGTRQYFGISSSLRSEGKIQLKDSADRKWQLKYKRPSLSASIPVGTSVGRQRRIHHHQIMYQEQQVGEITELLYEKVLNRFDVQYQKLTCQIYPVHYENFEGFVVFSGNSQIAQMNRETETYDLKDHYSLYLLDEESTYEIPLVLFILYYDHWYHGDRGQVRKNYQMKTQRYSFSEKMFRYDPEWLAKHFPNENAQPLRVDREEYEAKKSQRIFLQAVLELAFVILFPAIMVYLVVTNPIRLIPLSIIGIYFVVRWLFRHGK